MGKPVTPYEALQLKTSLIPPHVFDVVNNVVARALTSDGRSAFFNMNDVKKAFVDAGIDWNEAIKGGYLEFAGAYREQGWVVNVDHPGYNESYPTSWTFRSQSA